MECCPGRAAGKTSLPTLNGQRSPCSIIHRRTVSDGQSHENNQILLSFKPQQLHEMPRGRYTVFYPWHLASPAWTNPGLMDGKAAEGRRSPGRWREFQPLPTTRSVLECASSLALVVAALCERLGSTVIGIVAAGVSRLIIPGCGRRWSGLTSAATRKQDDGFLAG